ncbi:MAG: ABC transporter permease [Myxococcales bacterium]|nr:ABC transporter permease [Myxococcales bacterium]
MSVLDRKARRDLWRLKGQVATIALVLACGIMSMIMLRSTFQSLLAARDEYYTSHRLADVFARLERAPASVASRLARIPGVAVVETRVVEDVMVPLPGEPDPVAGRIVSIPDDGAPQLDDVYLRAGRLPGVGATDEAAILEQFATAQHLTLGDRLPVIINGRRRDLAIVGIALSPEYVLAMSGREMIADNRRFVVIWMLRGVVAPAYRMEGAFNDVALRLEPGTSLPAVLDAVDAELAPYGGLHAVPRAKQMSNYALTNELSVLRTLALVIPMMFLGVAAFLVNIVVSRLVFLERTQIAVLKALGFTDRRIGLHYLLTVGLIVMIAGALGVSLGAWSAGWMTNLYSDFYRFPTRVHHLSASLALSTLGVGIVAAVIGALGAVRKIARMPPAEAMRPPAPLAYRRSLLERLGLRHVLGPSAMMVVREITRRPLRFVMSTLGISMGLAIFIMGRFSWDSFDHLMGDVFPREHQEDMTVMFSRSQPGSVLHDLEHLPGVELAEGQRMVPVRIRVGTHWRDTVITGMPETPVLRHLLSGGQRPVELPATGLLMTDKLAEILGVRVGESVDVDVLEGDWKTHSLVVMAVLDEPFGLQAYARADWLATILRQEPRVTAALLRVDATDLDAIRARLKEMPGVLGVTSTERVIRAYRDQTGQSMLVMTLILTLSAAAIATGVVYNNARIALSMRSRDLASLRVLGFTRREISSILLGELGAQVLLGIPLGFILGRWFAARFAASIDPEAIRFPLHIATTTYATAAVIALVSGLVSALLVRRKLDHLDLVGVLKSSE